jgi:hypothetical protein
MTYIVCIPDWSSTDHSLSVDFQLSDEEDSPVQPNKTNWMDKMVKHARTKSFFDPKGQKMLVSTTEFYISINTK